MGGAGGRGSRLAGDHRSQQGETKDVLQELVPIGLR